MAVVAQNKLSGSQIHTRNGEIPRLLKANVLLLAFIKFTTDDNKQT